jgi:23S rRNA pseudouridine1911/1915/1917 synthase
MKEKRKFLFEGEKERLDIFLRDKNPDLTRSQIKLLIDAGFVLLNSKIAEKAGIFLKNGDNVEIEINDEIREELKVEPQDIEVPIIYEDEDIVVVNKPAGMTVHPAIGHRKDTLANALAYRYREILKMDKVRPGIVHRLDKEVSGVMVVARNYRARNLLAEQFKNKLVKKTYIACAIGQTDNLPSEGVISKNITRHPTNRIKMCVTENEGRESITKWKILKRKERYLFLLVNPLTGRTHQIRVHLSSEKMPVIGDNLYGGAKILKIDAGLAEIMNGYNGILLHSHSLSFTHPSTGEEMTFKTAPPPSFMKAFRHLFGEEIEIP